MTNIELQNIAESNFSLETNNWNDGKLFVQSKSFYGPRGECYHYALFEEGKLYALGNEQGNYAGGIYAYANQERAGYSNKEYPFLTISQYHIDELPTDLKEFVSQVIKEAR